LFCWISRSTSSGGSGGGGGCYSLCSKDADRSFSFLLFYVCWFGWVSSPNPTDQTPLTDREEGVVSSSPTEQNPVSIGGLFFLLTRIFVIENKIRFFLVVLTQNLKPCVVTALQRLPIVMHHHASIVVLSRHLHSQIIIPHYTEQVKVVLSNTLISSHLSGG
jgi:hypothetical protein